MPPPAERQITVQSCRPLTSEEAKARTGEQQQQETDDFYSTYYRGALVTDQSGGVYVYPSSAEDPCRQFVSGSAVTKIVDSTCCDTGPWGKCLYGGRWMWDPDGPPVNTFQ